MGTSEPRLDLTFGSTSTTTSTSSSTSETQAQVVETTPSADSVDSQTLSFTMMDVFQELEELKDQLTTASASNNYKSKNAKKYNTCKSKPNGKDDNLLSSHVSSLNPWSYFNRDVSFMSHNRKMKLLSDDDVIELANIEIGKRIAYHKERCENNEKRMHVHFRHKLNELKSRLDRSRAVVLIYVLQKRKEEEIEKLERKLFPFSTRVLLQMD